MKERPIIFQAWAIPKILDGAKTQTRRVVKPCSSATLYNGKQPEWVFTLAKCPYGQVGDGLWCKETFNVIETVVSPSPVPDKIVYKASPETYQSYLNIGWQPSIHMPRWASRIDLEITDVRAERLQQISIVDAEADSGVRFNPLMDYAPEDCLSRFESLWDPINAKRGYGWQMNPWVWVISFKAI